MKEMDLHSRNDATNVLKNALVSAEKQDYEELYSLSEELTKIVRKQRVSKWLLFKKLPSQLVNTPGVFVEEILDYWSHDANHRFFRGDLSENDWLKYIGQIIQQIVDNVPIEQLKKPWQYQCVK
jgi:hypothetical protein